MYFDSHCHLDFDSIGSVERVWTEANQQGVTAALIPGVSPEQWSALPTLCQRLQGTSYAVGLHPWWIDESIEPRTLERSLRKASDGAVAIGETGLDQTERGKRTPLKRQCELLEMHLRVANELALPIVLHCVRAHEPLLDVLNKTPVRSGGVVHSFSGAQELAKRLLDHDLHISFSCAALRFKDKKSAAIAAIPAERLLIETDAPDQSADRTKPGSPLDIVKVAARVAEARSCPVEEIARITRENAENLFGLSS